MPFICIIISTEGIKTSKRDIITKIIVCFCEILITVFVFRVLANPLTKTVYYRLVCTVYTFVHEKCEEKFHTHTHTGFLLTEDRVK